MKMSKSKARGIVNDAIHQMTKGKATEDIVEALKILEDNANKLKAILARRVK